MVTLQYSILPAAIIAGHECMTKVFSQLAWVLGFVTVTKAWVELPCQSGSCVGIVACFAKTVSLVEMLLQQSLRIINVPDTQTYV